MYTKEELYDNWSNETNDSATQEWRDDLTPEEEALVRQWDARYVAGLQRMAEALEPEL